MYRKEQFGWSTFKQMSKWRINQAMLHTQFCEVQRQVGVSVEFLPRWEGVLESGNKEGILSLHVSKGMLEDINQEFKCINVILLSLD